MKASIIQIGNSQGIRLPKAILTQCEFGNEIELEVAGKQLIIRRARNPREDWDRAFSRMAGNRDDKLQGHDMPLSAWDKGEWEWK